MKNTITVTVKELQSLGNVEATSEREGWIIEVEHLRVYTHYFALIGDRSICIDILSNLERSNPRAKLTYNTKVPKHGFLPNGRHVKPWIQELPITGKLVSIEFEA